MRTKLFLLFGLLCFVNLGFSQTEKQFIKGGNLAFENGRYYEAISYFDNALKFNKHNEDILYKTAMSYYHLKDYSNAAPFFEKVESKENFPLVDFYAGNNQKLLGNYVNAIDLFKSFGSYYPISGFYTEKAKQQIASCYWAMDQRVNDSLKIYQFEKPLNTGFSDFGATYFSENIIQVSSLQSMKKNLKDDFQSKLYFFEKEDNEVKKSERIIFPMDLEDSLDYANGFYLEEKNEFYYSQCFTEHEIGEKVCDIYVRKYENSNWTDPVSLNLNTKDFTETQAQVSINDAEETEIYFISDRSGGIGKLDIWKATELSYGNFTQPVNLPATINTVDNESTPYFDQKNQLLYFSSEWHYGFGGYDIFKSDLMNNNYSKPTNLGAPINSSANDQYYYPNKFNTALLSSNREGAMQLKGSACCYDVFELTLPEETLDIDTSLLVNIEIETSIETQLELIRNSLPATVYFHNDEPNPKTTSTTSNLSYQNCFEDYLKVENDYYQQFEDDAEIEIWFEKVNDAYDELNEFLVLLEIVLEKKSIELKIEGYCSPLALNDYNINLAKRRISSLENYILSWKSGVLIPFYSEGLLRFKAAPFGEETANPSISDSTSDVKQSIYNPNAAKERRVSIIAIEVL